MKTFVRSAVDSGTLPFPLENGAYKPDEDTLVGIGALIGERLVAVYRLDGPMRLRFGTYDYEITRRVALRWTGSAFRRTLTLLDADREIATIRYRPRLRDELLSLIDPTSPEPEFDDPGLFLRETVADPTRLATLAERYPQRAK